MQEAGIRAASFVGRRRLRRMLRDGLPGCYAAAFEYLLSGRLAGEPVEVAERIERIRSAMDAQTGRRIHTVVYDGAPPGAASQGRSLRFFARVASILPRWGMFLHLCARARGAETILELGASAGISGCYLASVDSCRRFITVEGSAELAELARQHIEQISSRAEVLNMRFEEALESVLPTLAQGLDMVYVDGGKAKAPNIRNFERVAPHLNPGALFVLDDIHWSREMWGAWQQIRRHRGFALTVNTGRLGWGLWEGGGHPRTYDLFGVAGIDLYWIKKYLE